MSSEAFINFCFIREKSGNFTRVIEQMLHDIFKGKPFEWKLREKGIDGAPAPKGPEMVIAEITGSSEWQYESETIDFFEQHADELFWDYLQGYHITLYPKVRGCKTCGTN